jgi:polar amino acid transport system substrate-binding protein
LKKLLIIFFISLITINAQQHVLRWGADGSGGAPYVFANPQNPSEYIGYEKDIAVALAKVMNVREEYVPTDWESLIASLHRGEFNIILNGLEPTSDREKEILFSKPYYVFQMVLTVRKNEQRIKSLEDCKKLNIEVGTLVNSAMSRVLENDQVKMRGYQDVIGAYQDLELGRIDAILMDDPAEMFYARNNPNLKWACQPFNPGTFIIGIRKGDTATKAKIDAAIDTIINNGTMQKILTKWNLWSEAQNRLKNNTNIDVIKKSFSWGQGLLRLLHAAAITVLLAFGAMLIAVCLGLPLSFGQTKGPRIVRILCTSYIEFFRGTPVIVQLLFLYFGLPVIGFSPPGWLTALIGLGLNYAAYESQIYRSAFDAIPVRQWDVAYSLSMRPMLAFRRIIFPQAFRIALPPMTNDFVALFKDTSAAFAIAVWELATAYRELANATQSYLLLGAIVSCFYLAMSLPLAHFAKKLEEKMKRVSNKREVSKGWQ